MIEYRWIENEELAILDPIFDEKGWTKLNLYTGTRALCAYEDNKLVGFFVLQLFPHTEPLYVDSTTHNSPEIAISLVRQMVEFIKSINIRGYMVVADTEFAKLMCERGGMQQIESPVYRG